MICFTTYIFVHFILLSFSLKLYSNEKSIFIILDEFYNNINMIKHDISCHYVNRSMLWIRVD